MKPAVTNLLAGLLKALPETKPFRIVPRAVRRSGRRARRQAFYSRARVARLCERIALAGFREQSAEIQKRYMNLVVYGTSHPEALADWRPSASPPAA